MGKVADLLEHKGEELWFVPPDASLVVAIQVMADQDIGAVAVIADGCLVGILSERDCVRRVMLAGIPPESVKVSEVMTPTVIFARPEFGLKSCLLIMTDNHIRHLPVIDHGKVIGLLTLGDVARALISNSPMTP